MNGNDLYNILSQKNVRTLHHANSVMTSISLIRLGGLASRHLVEKNGLRQSGQYTDELDRQFGIWDDVFMDTVDIHKRIRNRNQYGPVLFEVDVSILQALPHNARVLVSKLNPSKWKDSTALEDRYFEDVAEAAGGVRVGDFDQMLMIGNVGGIIPFGAYLQRIVLDDVTGGAQASQEFQRAAQELNQALQDSNINMQVSRRGCVDCRCHQSYSNMGSWQRNLHWAP